MTDIADLVAEVDALDAAMVDCATEGHDVPGLPWCDRCVNDRDRKETLIMEHWPELRAIVVAAQNYVEARTTGRNQEVGAAERELFAAVRGEA